MHVRVCASRYRGWSYTDTRNIAGDLSKHPSAGVRLATRLLGLSRRQGEPEPDAKRVYARNNINDDWDSSTGQLSFLYLLDGSVRAGL